jgi:hypothetical protein
VEIEFPQPQSLDEVTLECNPAWDAKLQVEVLLDSARWVPVTDTSELIKVEPPPGIRKAATRDVKALGFDYLLVNQDDFVNQDFIKNRNYWGITELAEVNGTRLYRID